MIRQVKLRNREPSAIRRRFKIEVDGWIGLSIRENCDSGKPRPAYRSAAPRIGSWLFAQQALYQTCQRGKGGQDVARHQL